MHIAKAQEVISFWNDEVGEEGWYSVDEAIDQKIRERFLGLWEEARDEKLNHWMHCAQSALALLIVTDQFPRNMFRGNAMSFATDGLARVIAHYSISNGFDAKINSALRQFFYLPFMHSEIASDQEKAVRMFLLRHEDSLNLNHARAHREIIRRFGRFPYRNEALGRVSTANEVAFLSGSGYQQILQELA